MLIQPLFPGPNQRKQHHGDADLLNIRSRKDTTKEANEENKHEKQTIKYDPLRNSAKESRETASQTFKDDDKLQKKSTSRSETLHVQGLKDNSGTQQSIDRLTGKITDKPSTDQNKRNNSDNRTNEEILLNQKKRKSVDNDMNRTSPDNLENPHKRLKKLITDSEERNDIPTIDFKIAERKVKRASKKSRYIRDS